MCDTKTYATLPPRSIRAQATDRANITEIAAGSALQNIDEDKPRGLCASCSLAPTCTYRHGTDRAIMFCDEFNGVLLPIPERRLYAPVANRSEESAGEARVRGLCATCTKRDSCTFPRPIGGVWHCEEFE